MQIQLFHYTTIFDFVELLHFTREFCAKLGLLHRYFLRLLCFHEGEIVK